MKVIASPPLKLLVGVALALSIVGNVIAIAAFLHVENLSAAIYGGSATRTYSVGGDLFIPPTFLANAPVITATAAPGQRLTGINSPLSPGQLAVFNNASDVFFQQAGTMLVGGSLQNQISTSAVASNLLIVNGKSSVIYLGAISCVFCGENRWAMALALGKFGTFNNLFFGYSALGDGDVPTIYWRPVEYNASSAVEIGNFYSSGTVNFLSIEYASPITARFQMQSLSYISHQVEATSNGPYNTAMQVILSNNNYAGTPYTIWGKYAFPQASGVILGNSSASSTLASLTHAQVLSELSSPHDQFGWSEYAAADVYVSLLCASLQNGPHVCHIPAIGIIETTYGY
jgi:hypothetical protein